jgi:hypothetical protein
MAYDPEPLSEETMAEIEEEIRDIQAAGGRPSEEVAREWGLEWVECSVVSPIMTSNFGFILTEARIVPKEYVFFGRSSPWPCIR